MIRFYGFLVKVCVFAGSIFGVGLYVNSRVESTFLKYHQDSNYKEGRCKKMEFSNEYYARLILIEGFRAKAYRCPSGVWTIGYGTTTGVKQGMVINQNQAFKLLQDDSSKLELHINKLGVAFTQNQFDAVGLFLL